MAVTPDSSRDDIRQYQQQLNSAGAEPPLVIDGLWGPKTQAAHESYGESVPNEGDGDPDSGSESDGALVGTGPEDTEPRFGIAGGAELWKNTTTGDSYIVYAVPDTDPPYYMRWTVATEADVQSFFGPGKPVVYQQEFADDDPVWGREFSQDFGSSDDIVNTAKSPFDSWASTLEQEARSQPWLLDPDYQRLLAMSIIEERPLTNAEIEGTQWYIDHSQGERSWMLLSNSDPASAQQYIEDNRIAQLNALRQAGISNPDEELANFIADKVSMGTWTPRQAALQVDLLSDSYFSEGQPGYQELDTDLQDFLVSEGITVDQDQDKEVEVRNLVQQWLGTNFGDWDDQTVSEWAGRLRNESDATEVLTETLKDQRFALFPEYDREASYQTIASPWKNMMRNVWGEVPQDSDQTLHSIIRMNDASEASRFLTTEGLNQGNKNVENQVQDSLMRAFGAR